MAAARVMQPFTYNAKVVRWVDGDTVWLDVDLGFRMTGELDMRLLDVNTPERGQPGYEEAKQFVSEVAPAGSSVVIRTYKNPDKYGRWLVTVYRADDVINSINTQLLTRTLAVAYAGGAR